MAKKQRQNRRAATPAEKKPEEKVENTESQEQVGEPEQDAKQDVVQPEQDNEPDDGASDGGQQTGNQAVAGQISSGGEFSLNKPARSLAKNNPVIVGGEDVREYDDGSANHIRQFDDGPIDADEYMDASPRLITTNATESEVVRLKNKEDEMEFQKQILFVEILPTQEKNPVRAFEISVNGERYVLQHDCKYKMPRYAVEGLMRARPVNYRNEEYLDDQGDRAVRHPASRSLRFPFRINYDPAGQERSVQWQRSVMRQQ